jgi:hypothetical protein
MSEPGASGADDTTPPTEPVHAGPAEPPPVEPTPPPPPPSVAYPPPVAYPSAAVRPPWPRWVLPLIVGVAGLVLGLVIGGLGGVLIGRQHGGPGFGDRRGYYYQQGPRGGPPMIRRGPVRPPLVTPSPQATPS